MDLSDDDETEDDGFVECKPKNADESVAICEAYKKNHPKFKDIEGETWYTVRERIVGLINEEIRKIAKQLAKRKKRGQSIAKGEAVDGGL
jgi:hypothetical protein